MRHAPVITRLTHQARPLDDDALAELYAAPRSPWLRVNFVTSVDGAVAVAGVSAGLSNPQDQRVMELLRMHSDAVLLGAGTFRTERYGASLLAESRRAWRRHHGLTDHPTMVIVSGSLRLDPRDPAFVEAPHRPIVLTSATAPPERRAALAATTDVLTAGEQRVDLAEAVAALHRRGLRQILAEGGPHLLAGLTAADLVDEMCLTISPVLAGPGAGRITAGDASPPRHLALRQVLATGDALLLRYVRATRPDQ